MLQLTVVIKYIMEEAEERLETIGNWLWCLREIPSNDGPPPRKAKSTSTSVSTGGGKSPFIISTQAGVNESHKSSDHPGPPKRKKKATRSNSSSGPNNESRAVKHRITPEVISHPDLTKREVWDLMMEEEQQMEMVRLWMDSTTLDKNVDDEDSSSTSE
jgi:hypothetical protein